MEAWLPEKEEAAEAWPGAVTRWSMDGRAVEVGSENPKPPAGSCVFNTVLASGATGGGCELRAGTSGEAGGSGGVVRRMRQGTERERERESSRLGERAKRDPPPPPLSLHRLLLMLLPMLLSLLLPMLLLRVSSAGRALLQPLVVTGGEHCGASKPGGVSETEARRPLLQPVL